MSVVAVCFAAVSIGLLWGEKRMANAADVWRQWAVVCFPVALFFVSGAFSAVRPKDAPWPRVLLPAVIFVLCFAGALWRWLALRRRAKEKLCLPGRGFFIVLAIYIALMLPYIGASPLWDAGLYYSALLKGIFRFDFSFASFFSSFLAYRHPSFIYLMLLAPGQYLFPGSAIAVNISTLLLGAAILFAFYRLAQRLFPASEGAACLAALLFAITPDILAFTTGVNPDFGMLAGFCFVLYSYATDQRILLVAGGLLLLFSKEPGLVLYGGFCLGALLFSPSPISGDGRGRALLRRALRLWYMLLPLTAFGVYVLLNNGLARLAVSGGGTGLFFGQSRSFQINITHILNILLQVFALNFRWLAALLLLAAVVWRLLRKRDFHLPPLWGAMLVAWGCYLVFTLLYVEIDLQRYNLPTLLPLTALTAWALARLPLKRWGARLFPAALAAAYGLSVFFSLDPVSFRAFPYSHDMGGVSLTNMTRIPGFTSLCEQVIYNRQYLAYGQLLDDILADNGVDEGRPYATFNMAPFSLQFFGNGEDIYRLSYSPSQGRRVFYAEDALPIPGREYMLWDEDDMAGLPGRMLWIVLPFQPQSELDAVRALYDIGEHRGYTRAGMRLDVYDCRLKPAN